jgi:hypothetical protein
MRLNEDLQRNCDSIRSNFALKHRSENGNVFFGTAQASNGKLEFCSAYQKPLGSALRQDAKRSCGTECSQLSHANRNLHVRSTGTGS